MAVSPAPKRTRKGKDLLAGFKKGRDPVQKKRDLPLKPAKTNELPAKVSIVEITEKNEGQRLDNFLVSFLGGVPKSHVYRIIRSGEVRIDGKRAKAETKLAYGDKVRIPPVRVEDKTRQTKASALKQSELPVILFEDRDLLVVDKPAGVACHGGSGISFGMIERLRATFPEEQFLELAHRLDRDTSGVLILAKSRKALVRLHEMMREGEVHKSYLTLVKGDWVNERQHVKLPLHKYVTPSGERRVRVDEELGLPSHTIFKLIRRFDRVSYLEVDLKTGRTHQIRVNAQASGLPLVGAEKYGDYMFTEQVAAGILGIPFKRMFLHAHRVAFVHPVTGIDMVIEAPLPADCRNLIDELEKNEE